MARSALTSHFWLPLVQLGIVTITVAACYSKRRRCDTQVLHREVVSRLREWLQSKNDLDPNALLFPVSAKVPGGVDRRTSHMMRADLKAARKKWIKESKTMKERKEREKSDFLKYQNDAGLFADLHSLRHTFITNLERAGVSPRTAQTLARHCDIRLTMGIYTHIGLNDQSTAIELLPAPPELAVGKVGTEQGNGNGKLSNGEVANAAPAVDVAQLWPTLPDNVKAGILAMINAAGGTGEGCVGV